MNARIRTVIGLVTVLATCMSVPAFADSTRMQLHCDGGTLAGTTLERSNGSSWWDQSDGSVYTTRDLTITDGGGAIVFAKSYGQKSGAGETCSGGHFGFTWSVEVVRSGARS